ncbi:lytic transglycosylase domain-containing protein [Pseudomonas sp. EMN2]|uniref:lytic transglycosylase domain-containing protein n=1 Tax=Pseudomonas sp. EMN2 TaxID=2615212 RepID=UPI00129ACDCF|nr:lytic transglycosylase domain-containing protein [Pseudomonas sp. EMN2]
MSPSKLLGVALTLLFCLSAAPASGARTTAVSPLTPGCIVTIAKRHQVHPDILFAILIVEGGTAGRDSRANSNGTYDIGLFQINSMHTGTFAAMGLSETVLRNNGCANAEAAAWHLNRVVTPAIQAGIKSEDDYLRAIARYHSATPKYNQIYADKLRKAFALMYRGE